MEQILYSNSDEETNLYSIWNECIRKNKRHVIQNKNISPIIARSWERCRNIDPDINPHKNIFVLPLKKLEIKQNKNRELISIVSPILQYICDVGGNTFVMLADSEGYIIEMKSNVNYNNMPAIGSKCREEDIGTNAIGTALVENDLVEIKKYQHYSSHLHEISCVAMPIHNGNGEIIGVIDMSYPYNTVNQSMEILLTMGIHFIEYQLQNKMVNTFNKQNWNTFKNTIYPYMIVYDINGKIVDMNERCQSIFRTCNKESNDLKLSDIIKDGKDSLINITYNNSRYKEFKLIDDKVYRVINKSVIKDKEGKPNTLILFKDTKLDMKEQKNFSFNNIVGKEEKWQQVLLRAKKAAVVSSSVLIEGESGTGKELIARAIHSESMRKGLFIAINCGAIPGNLIESELFGYEDGAFTGAKKGGMKGKIETANGGTLFLDEIGEMPLDMQVHLLRFLEDKTVTRIGGSNTIKVDVRIISATNRNLREEVEKGRFRQDLYYRLNVINIQLPPLRDRKEDITRFVDYFIAKYAEKFQRENLCVDESSMKFLCQYQWPGNVRELSNIVENAVVFTEGDVILPGVLPSYIKKADSYPKINESLKENEKEIIITALKKHNGNITRAAEALGIARNTLYNKIRYYKIINF